MEAPEQEHGEASRSFRVVVRAVVEAFRAEPGPVGRAARGPSAPPHRGKASPLRYAPNSSRCESGGSISPSALRSAGIRKNGGPLAGAMGGSGSVTYSGNGWSGAGCTNGLNTDCIVDPADGAFCVDVALSVTATDPVCGQATSPEKLYKKRTTVEAP